jgi:glycerol-3-phosphate dehydrogenase (NAD+)
MKVVVLGSGSFGTAMATVLARNGHAVVMVTRSSECSHSINEKHRNPFYLTDYELPENLTATTDMASALAGAGLVVHSVPVQATHAYLTANKDKFDKSVPFVSTSKGLHTETLQMMNEIIEEVLGADQRTAFFSGPSFAKELMASVPTAVVVASADEATANFVRAAFAGKTLRVYTTADVTGVEVGGALKNVFAIAAGVLEGMNLGQNTAAALVTRGCSEMNRLARVMGAHQDTMAGLSGMGDLILTCMGSLSRNKSVGLRLGRGETLDEIRATMKEVAEGVATTPAAVKLARKHGLTLHIIEAVNKLLEGQMTAKAVVEHLMTLPVDKE